MNPKSPSSLRARIKTMFARFRADRRGNILIMTGIAIIPLTFAIGFGIDYSRAEKIKTKLDAAADAAALAAVDPSMINRSDDEALAAATNMFNSQIAGISGLASIKMTPNVSDSTTTSSGSVGFLRKATISYTAQSKNLFGGILDSKTLTINGSSSASAQQPPNINFYVAMDNSPSMLLPATSSGLTNITTATTTSHLANGCTFACHEMIPHSDAIYVNDKSGRQVLLSSAYYTAGSAKKGVYYLWNPTTSSLYTSLGALLGSSSSSKKTTTSDVGSGSTAIHYVIDTTTAVVVSYTITDSTSGPVTINQLTTTTITTVTNTTKGGLTTVSTVVGTPSVSKVTYDTGYWADGYWLTHNYGLIYGTPASITLRRDDVISAVTQLVPFASQQAADYSVTYNMQLFAFNWTHPLASSPVTTLNSMTDVDSYPSTFSAASLFAVDDYWFANSKPTSSTNINDQGTEIYNTLKMLNGVMATPGTGAATSTPQEILFLITDGMVDEATSSGRWHGPFNSNDLAQCTAIKARGIKIAILYTQYLSQALYGDSWSQSNIAPYLPPPPSPYPAGNAGSSDQVLTALQQCASPGSNGQPLVQSVTTDGNFTAALQQLFSTALQAARLIQ